MATEAYIADWRGKQVFTLATKANMEAMKKAAHLVEGDVKRHFTLIGSGRIYKRGKKIHRASAPGEAPAIDNNILRSSIMSNVFVDDNFNVIGQVGPDIEHIAERQQKRIAAGKTSFGTDVNYGLYLELGTRRVTKSGIKRMAPRPFLRPALRRTRHDVRRIFMKANGI